MKPRRPQPPAPAVPAGTVTLDIDGYIHDGRGLARHNGQAVFVAGALQGERVEARWSRRQARFSEARTLQVLSASAERVGPVCRHYGQCGGCQLQHARPAHQLTIKQNAVLDQLARAGVAPARQLLPPVTAEPWHYRARARLAVLFDKAGRLSFGFRRQGDKQLVNVQQCPVLPEALQALLEPLRTWLQSYSVKAVSHVELIQAQGQVGVVLRHIRPLKPAHSEALERSGTSALVPGVAQSG